CGSRRAIRTRCAACCCARASRATRGPGCVRGGAGSYRRSCGSLARCAACGCSIRALPPTAWGPRRPRPGRRGRSAGRAAGAWRRVRSGALAARARAALSVDVREELRACRLPLLYLAASEDRVIAPSHGREILALVPGARLETIEGPHLALFTNPADAAAIIG